MVNKTPLTAEESSHAASLRRLLEPVLRGGKNFEKTFYPSDLGGHDLVAAEGKSNDQVMTIVVSEVQDWIGLWSANWPKAKVVFGKISSIGSVKVTVTF